MPNAPKAPKLKGTELSRFLTTARTEAGLTSKEVAAAIKLPVPDLEAYEAGKKKPTRLMLDRLTAALGCENLATRFPPIAPLDARALAQPGNVALRLRHLVNVVAEGNQRRFAHGAGWAEGVASQVLTGRQALSGALTDKLLAALPTLSEKWLRQGNGSAFPEGIVPTFGPPPKPEKVTAPYVYNPDSWLTPRVQPTAVIPTLDPLDRDPMMARAKPTERLDSLITRLGWVSDRECGLTPYQAKSVIELLQGLR